MPINHTSLEWEVIKEDDGTYALKIQVSWADTETRDTKEMELLFPLEGQKNQPLRPKFGRRKNQHFRRPSRRPRPPGNRPPPRDRNRDT